MPVDKINLETVFRAIFNRKQEALKRRGKPGVFAVYMAYDFWVQCTQSAAMESLVTDDNSMPGDCAEFYGAQEFRHTGTVLGCDVWAVAPPRQFFNIRQPKRHKAFTIVDLTREDK